MESIWLESPVAVEELIHVKKQALNNIEEDKNAHHAAPLKFVYGLPVSILKSIRHVWQLQGSLFIMNFIVHHSSWILLCYVWLN